MFLRFVWLSVISLYSINLVGFINETDSVYCAVRSVSLNVIRLPKVTLHYNTLTSSRNIIAITFIRNSFMVYATRLWVVRSIVTYSMEQSPSWEANWLLQLVKKFPAFYGTRKFITVLTSARHLSLSWANSIQSPQTPPTSWRSILILSSH
jgi:hypothetical protein